MFISINKPLTLIEKNNPKDMKLAESKSFSSLDLILTKVLTKTDAFVIHVFPENFSQVLSLFLKGIDLVYRFEKLLGNFSPTVLSAKYYQTDSN